MAETAKTPRRIGYARVSTYEQALDARLAQRKAAGCSRIYRVRIPVESSR